MKIKNKYINFIIKYFISLIIYTIMSIIILWILYDFELKNDYISNSFFIPNILIFIFSIGINVGAGNIFNPLVYTFKKFLNIFKKNHGKFIDYHDYLDIKEKKYNYWYSTLASFTLLIVAFIYLMV